MFPGSGAGKLTFPIFTSNYVVLFRSPQIHRIFTVFSSRAPFHLNTKACKKLKNLSIDVTQTKLITSFKVPIPNRTELYYT